MDQQPSKSQRHRFSPYLRRGLLLIMIPVLVVAAGYGAIELFARYGGDWAMSDQIPVPPDSQQIQVFYGDAAFMMKSAFYAHHWAPETLRDWFIEQGIYLTVNPYGEHKYLDSAGYYNVLGYEVTTFKRTLHRSAIQYTHPDLRWLGDVQAGCGGWTVFKSPDDVSSIFEGLVLEVPEGKSVFAIHTCWPNLDEAPPNQPVYPVPLN